jgi:cold-inducible RNA-binding protein
MSKKIFVGGLAFSTTEDELRNLFEPFGQIETVQIVIDRYTQKSRGFGFVEMTSDEEAAKAIEALNGKELAGRALTVNEARPPQRREGGGGGGRGGFGGGRGGFGGGGGGRGGPRRGGGGGDRGGGGRW